MKKIPFAKNTWFDWCNLLLINCIPDPPIKTMGGVKDKIISLFKTNATKNHSKPGQIWRKRKDEEETVCKKHLV